jgi:putative oxidoreductase
MNPNHAQTAAFINRIALGSMFLAHGLLKVFVFTLPGTAGFFQSVGFPGWTAYLVTFAEIGGGIALLLGLRTRIVAASLLPVLLGALYVHLGNGWVFSAPNGGWEYPAFLVVSAVVQLLLGDGHFALWPERTRVPGSLATRAA